MQTIIDKTQKALATAIRGMAALEKRSCNAAASDPECAGPNADFTDALGYLYQAKAAATRAADAMPGVGAQFGGK